MSYEGFVMCSLANVYQEILWLAHGLALVVMRICPSGADNISFVIREQLATVLAVLNGSVGMI